MSLVRKLLIAVMALPLVAACASNPAPPRGPGSPTSAPPSPGLSCELTSPGPVSCATIAAIARADVPLGSDIALRVVDAAGGALRTGQDLALVVATSNGGIVLVLVGYVGIDPTPLAWIPDPALYPAWYQEYAPHNP